MSSPNLQLAGPVTYLRVLNQDLVVLNTVKVATDLLEKRSAIYSDRPRMTMINEVYVHSFCKNDQSHRCASVGCGWITVLMPYSPWWRQHRRVLQHNLSENASAQWSDMRTRFNSVFLKRMVDAPGDWWALTQWFVCSRFPPHIRSIHCSQACRREHHEDDLRLRNRA